MRHWGFVENTFLSINLCPYLTPYLEQNDHSGMKFRRENPGKPNSGINFTVFYLGDGVRQIRNSLSVGCDLMAIPCLNRREVTLAESCVSAIHRCQSHLAYWHKRARS